MPALYDDAAVAAAVATLDHWHGDRTAIKRVVYLDDDAVGEFLSELERVAREMNHDPEIDRGEGELTITMSTHSAGGVTDLDVEYARRVDDLVIRLP
jgi:4a-hydroxytetrahydrobiopterin dehydratase